MSGSHFKVNDRSVTQWTDRSRQLIMSSEVQKKIYKNIFNMHLTTVTAVNRGIELETCCIGLCSLPH